MKRRRAPKPVWGWCNQIYLQGSEIQGTPAGEAIYQGTALLPPNRVSYLCDTRNKKALYHRKTLLWLKAWFTARDTRSGSGEAVTLPTVNFYIMRSQATAAQSESDYQYQPFATPAVPQTLVNWDDDTEEGSGLDPFLWCHTWPAGPTTGCIINTASDSGGDGSGVNAGDLHVPAAAQSSPTVYMGYSLFTQQAWRPDVEVKAVRKLAREQWLVLGAQILTNPGTVQSEGFSLKLNMLASWRTLIS